MPERESETAREGLAVMYNISGVGAVTSSRLTSVDSVVFEGYTKLAHSETSARVWCKRKRAARGRAILEDGAEIRGWGESMG